MPFQRRHTAPLPQNISKDKETESQQAEQSQSISKTPEKGKQANMHART